MVERDDSSVPWQHAFSPPRRQIKRQNYIPITRRWTILPLTKTRSTLASHTLRCELSRYSDLTRLGVRATTKLRIAPRTPNSVPNTLSKTRIHGWQTIPDSCDCRAHYRAFIHLRCSLTSTRWSSRVHCSPPSESIELIHRPNRTFRCTD
jgi:hypothetical protein